MSTSPVREKDAHSISEHSHDGQSSTAADSGTIDSEMATSKDELNPTGEVALSSSSSSSSPSPSPPAPPPAPAGPVDGGLVCWLQVLGVFMVWMNSWGIFNTYGEYQTYYKADLLSHRSQDDLAWVGSVEAFLLFIGGAVTGAAFDAGYFTYILCGGHLLVVFGLMMTSLCSKYWEVMLAQGFVVGIGMGLLFTPGLSIIPQYWNKRRALASGIASAGSGVGGLIYPIIFRQLQPRIGFGWATRVIAFVALFAGIISALTLRTKTKPGKIRELIAWECFREPPYGTFLVAFFLICMGIYVPYFYIGGYALELGITGPHLAFYLVSIINGSSIVGRILPGALADKVGMVNVCIMLSAGCGIMAFCWIAIKGTAGLIVFAVLYGFFAGGTIGLAPVVCIVLTKDMRRFGTRLGTGCFIGAFGVLIGTPISGAILNDTGEFTGLQAFGGAVMLAAAAFLLLTRWTVLKWSLFGKI